MEKNKFLLSIIKCPSFNLLAFQAFTFVIMIIAGAAGAFQFVPFFGTSKISWYYIYEVFLFAAITYIYLIVIFTVVSTLNKVYILFNKKFIISKAIVFYFLFGILTLLLQYQKQNESDNINLAQGIFGYSIILIFELFLFTIFPYIIMFFIEQINNIRLSSLPYFKTPLRMCAVVIPALVYVCVILYILIEMLT